MGLSDGEEGDIILGWLVRLVLGVSVAALVVFEGGALGFAHLSADDAAGEVARAGAVAYRASGSLLDARTTAEEVATARHVELVAFERDGEELVVVVERAADTLVLQRIGALEGFVVRAGERRVGIGN